MSTPRPGATRPCPHCRATILESAGSCPGCRGRLRFEAQPGTAARRPSPLCVEGTLRPGPGDAPLEYSVVLAIRNERGEEIARHVVGVGAIRSGEERRFALDVEVHEADGPRRR